MRISALTVMKRFMVLILTFLSVAAFATDEWETVPGRVVMLAAGAKLRASYPAVHFIGVTDKGAICELSMSDKNMSIFNGVGLDGVFNPYWALMKDGSNVSANTDTTSNGIREIRVDVSSSIDDSSASLIVRLDEKKMFRANGKDIAQEFVSGNFIFDRGPRMKTVCNLRARAFSKQPSDWPITLGQL